MYIVIPRVITKHIGQRCIAKMPIDKLIYTNNPKKAALEKGILEQQMEGKNKNEQNGRCNSVVAIITW